MDYVVCWFTMIVPIKSVKSDNFAGCYRTGYRLRPQPSPRLRRTLPSRRLSDEKRRRWKLEMWNATHQGLVFFEWFISWVSPVPDIFQNVSDISLHQYGYGSIPIHTIFSGMNIHLPAILMFTRGTRVLTHPHLGVWRIGNKKTGSSGDGHCYWKPQTSLCWPVMAGHCKKQSPRPPRIMQALEGSMCAKENLLSRYT